MKSNMQTSKPLLLLCVFFLLTQFINGLVAVRAGTHTVSIWFSLASLWAIGWWFIHDSRNHGIRWADDYLDIGMFLYMAWIFVLPYYLFQSRGWKAILVIAMILFSYFGSYFSGILIASLISAFV